MTTPQPASLHRPGQLPALASLGRDLTDLTACQRCWTVVLPFLCVAGYVLFALLDWWPLAVGAVAAYTFFSYGSTSHDLVHGNLGLPDGLNRTLLSIIELLGLRSGHAYRAAHLHHHRRFPDAEDVEGTAAHGSLLEAILAGPVQQSRTWWWALRQARHYRKLIILEGIGALILFTGAIIAWKVTPVPLVYVVLVVLGSWTFPLITAYLPHNANGTDALTRTRRFRGKIASWVFGQHLYHLEHHLYPRVPHQHWPALARRLDPCLDRAGVKAIYFGF